MLPPVLAINGSHRNGNTQFMLTFILQQFKNKGYPVKLINLREKTISFANQSDYSCSKTKDCTCCRDDMKDIYPELQSAGLVIFGSPCYFWNVSGRMKVFIDRCNPYWWSKHLQGKPAALLAVGASTEKLVQTMVEMVLKPFVTMGIGMEIKGTYITIAENENEVAKNYKAIAELKAFANSLMIQ